MPVAFIEGSSMVQAFEVTTKFAAVNVVLVDSSLTGDSFLSLKTRLSCKAYGQ